MFAGLVHSHLSTLLESAVPYKHQASNDALACVQWNRAVIHLVPSSGPVLAQPGLSQNGAVRGDWKDLEAELVTPTINYRIMQIMRDSHYHKTVAKLL